MTPQCCKDCKRKKADPSTCPEFKRCVRWLAWFGREWEGIQKAAEQCKPKEDET